MAKYWCKMEPEDEEPVLTIQIVCNKTRFFFYIIVCNYITIYPSISLNDGEIFKGTAPDTVGTTVTAPEVTSTLNEHTSEVTHLCAKLPIGAPAAPIRMVPLPEVPNGPCLRPDPLPLVPEFFSPFPLPGSISPLHSLVETDLRTDERPLLMRIQKPKALGEKPQSFAVVSGSSCSTSAGQIDMLPPIDHGKLRGRHSEVSIGS